MPPPALDILQAAVVVAGPGPITLTAPPVAGHLLVLAVACHGAAPPSIPVPAGWAAASPEVWNGDPGFQPLLQNWKGRLFYRTSDGSEQSVADPSAGATSSLLAYIECNRGGALLAAAQGFNPHVPGAIPIGNLAADGYAPLNPGTTADALFVAVWQTTGDFFGTIVTVDQPGGEIPSGALPVTTPATQSLALVALPVNPGVPSRLTGTMFGNDNFPAWALAAFVGSDPGQGYPPDYW